MRMRLSAVNARLLRSIRALAGGLPSETVGETAGAASAEGEGVRGGQPLLVIEDFTETPWASLTFSGIRHGIDIRLDGDEAEVRRVVAELADWPDSACEGLAGHFLADVQVQENSRVLHEGGRMSLCLRLDALTIAE